MKEIKLILGLALSLLIFSTTFAQVVPGSIFASGASDLGFSTGSSKYETTINGNTNEMDGPSTFSINFSPKVGYCIIDGVVIGIHADISSMTSKRDEELEAGDTETLTDKNNSLLVGPFARYYADLGTENIMPFGEVSVGVGSTKNEYEYFDYNASGYTVESSESKYNVTRAGIGAGIALFLTNNVAVDVMVGYNLTLNNLNSDSDVESKSTSNSIGIDFGFSVLIPQK